MPNESGAVRRRKKESGTTDNKERSSNTNPKYKNRKGDRVRRAFVVVISLLLCGVVFHVFDRTAATDGALRGRSGDGKVSKNRLFPTLLFVDAVALSGEAEVDANGGATESKPWTLEKEEELIPTLKYGTAWKKDRTAELVRKAVLAGFRHIDTACQPKHYDEAGVGEGWTAAARETGLTRSDLWLQTKYTSLDGQDPHRVPYDAFASLEDRVRQSVAKSLENLRTDYLDSLVMHGPERDWRDTLRVWAVFEELVRDGRVRRIGVSNAPDAAFVRSLHDHATIKPSVVQQRLHAETGYESEMRAFCREKGIEFQSFWTIGANRHALVHEDVRLLAEAKGLTPVTLLYAFCMSIGITVLDGTTSERHMEEDVAIMRRMRDDGDPVFDDKGELSIVADALKIPGWWENEVGTL